MLAAPSQLPHRPDYAGQGIVNLMASVAAACGGRLPYVPLATGAAAITGDGPLVLLLLDGLGCEYLAAARPGGALQAHRAGRLTSVFPSTTATAVTTVLTGLAPQQHGLTGWHMYFREIDRIAAVLPATLRGDRRPVAELGLGPDALFPYLTLFERIARPSVAITPRHLAGTVFNVAHTRGAAPRPYENVRGYFEAVAEAALAGPEAKFVYAYYPGLDSVAHQHGIASRAAAAELAALDDGFAALLERLRGTGATVIATADHGFVDAARDERVELGDHPRLAAMLARPLCGEQRVAYCYVRPESHADFADYVGDRLAGRVTLLRSADALAAGMFGPGAPHPELGSRIGDYIMLMRGRATIKDWLPGEKRYVLTGVHGGLTPEELYVPLVVARP